MPKILKPLTWTEVKHLPNGTFNVGGVPGLYLRKSDSYCFYFLRYQNNTGRHDYTLGTFSKFTLSEARQAAFRIRESITQGICPIAERQRIRLVNQAKKQQALKNIVSKKLSFLYVAEAWIEDRVKNNYWVRNVRGEFNTRRQLELYAFPIIGSMPIESIDAPDVYQCLKPIWQSKPSTAKKLKSTMYKVFQWAIAMGYRKDQNNPLARGGSLEVLIEPLSNNQKAKENYAACAVNELPQLFAELELLHSMSARACQFAILTAARSKAVRMAQWCEFDLKKGIWSIPIEHDKIKTPNRDRTIYLSSQAIRLLKNLPRAVESDFVFFSTKFGAFSDCALSMCLRGLHENKLSEDNIGWIDPVKTKSTGKPAVITLHGTARATFRTWAKSDELGNNRNFDQEAVELCLLHSKNDAYQGAYDRAKLTKERQFIMQQWGMYCVSAIKVH